MSGLGETPWVDRNLQLAWERILAVAPQGGEGMPLIEKVGGRGKAIVQEYGCGHYGCVMPTSVPGVVVKLSSDPTEAYFIAAALQLGFDYENAGIVQYYAVYQLANAFHRKRPLFVIWREEAYDLGFPLEATRSYGLMPADAHWRVTRDKELLRLLDSFKFFAAAVRTQLEGTAKRGNDPYALVTEAKTNALMDWAWNYVDADAALKVGRQQPMARQGHAHLRGVQRLAANLRACSLIAEWMGNTDGSDTIGRALEFYLDSGLLLADVHGDNVGKVERHDDIYDGEVRVITDPGHAVPLERRWAEVVIEEI